MRNSANLYDYSQNLNRGVGGGGYSGFQVTGMIEGFWGGLKSLIQDFLG